MLAGQLDKAGLPKAFAGAAAGLVGGWPWWWALAALLVVYLYSHYAFASLVAHVTAMFPAFLRRGDRPRRAAAAGRAGARVLLEPQRGDHALRHRAGADRVRRRLPDAGGNGGAIGFLISLVHLAIWLPIGFLWWKAIGLW